MEIADVLETTEGSTRLLVPRRSVTDLVPPKRPAFFNPRARLSRDYSIIAYAAFLKRFDGQKTFLEGLAGTGPRGLRVANELDVQGVAINDLNPAALEMARQSAILNGIKNAEFSGMDVCRFLSGYSEGGRRGAIVDIDPFGSPAAFFDCAIRATMHGGLLSAGATDLQVLNGLFQSACRRKYGGTSLRTEYGNEIAIRLVLGCLGGVAGRLGTGIEPLFAESNMHYYRVYVRVQRRPGPDHTGYILHCTKCGHRETSPGIPQGCALCGSKISAAGPLWIGRIFDAGFVQDMLGEVPGLSVDKTCESTLEKCLAEADLPGTYLTLDEVASRTGLSPPKMQEMIRSLEGCGHTASRTSLNPTGFRTDADISEVAGVLESIR